MSANAANHAIASRNDAKDAFLRESVSIIVRNHGPEDIVRVLGEVMDDYAATYARKTGDYDGASAMKLVAAHLETLDDYLENYDGGEP